MVAMGRRGCRRPGYRDVIYSDNLGKFPQFSTMGISLHKRLELLGGTING